MVMDITIIVVMTPLLPCGQDDKRVDYVIDLHLRRANANFARRFFCHCSSRGAARFDMVRGSVVGVSTVNEFFSR
jgi:hypothetical protein